MIFSRHNNHFIKFLYFDLPYIFGSDQWRRFTIAGSRAIRGIDVREKSWTGTCLRDMESSTWGNNVLHTISAWNRCERRLEIRCCRLLPVECHHWKPSTSHNLHIQSVWLHVSILFSICRNLQVQCELYLHLRSTRSHYPLVRGGQWAPRFDHYIIRG